MCTQADLLGLVAATAELFGIDPCAVDVNEAASHARCGLAEGYFAGAVSFLCAVLI
jgi:hypothetical protein